MKIYFAGAAGGGRVGPCKRETELKVLWKQRLWTFYYLLEFSNDIHGGRSSLRQRIGDSLGANLSSIPRPIQVTRVKNK